jgi:hypothetical protein
MATALFPRLAKLKAKWMERLQRAKDVFCGLEAMIASQGQPTPGILDTYRLAFSANSYLRLELTERIRGRLFGQSIEGFNLSWARALNAAIETAAVINRDYNHIDVYSSRESLWADCLATIPCNERNKNVVLEFGVAGGESINHMASLRDDIDFYGFDTFTGLPEPWRTGFGVGSFCQETLPVVQKNVTLVQGLIEETLPDFLADNRGAAWIRDHVRLLHIDTDIYSPASYVLANIVPHLRAGSIIVFDDFWNYPGWQSGEYKAFIEFDADHPAKLAIRGYVDQWRQAYAVVLHD